MSSRTLRTVARSSVWPIPSMNALSSAHRAAGSSGGISTRFAITSGELSSDAGSTEALISFGDSRPWYMSVRPSTLRTEPSSAWRTAS